MPIVSQLEVWATDQSLPDLTSWGVGTCRALTLAFCLWVVTPGLMGCEVEMQRDLVCMHNSNITQVSNGHISPPHVCIDRVTSSSEHQRTLVFHLLCCGLYIWSAVMEYVSVRLSLFVHLLRQRYIIFHHQFFCANDCICFGWIRILHQVVRCCTPTVSFCIFRFMKTTDGEDKADFIFVFF